MAYIDLSLLLFQFQNTNFQKYFWSTFSLKEYVNTYFSSCFKNVHIVESKESYLWSFIIFGKSDQLVCFFFFRGGSSRVVVQDAKICLDFAKRDFQQLKCQFISVCVCASKIIVIRYLFTLKRDKLLSCVGDSNDFFTNWTLQVAMCN